MRRIRIVLVVVTLVAVIAACGSDGTDGSDPEASDDTARGAQLFDNNCAACHGPQGTGTNQGPPLVHEIYEPGHHPDETFQRAAAEGTPSHHWDFGDMPPVPGIEADEVEAIIAYIRELQREAGIIP